MENVFNINLTDNTDNEQIDGHMFITNRLSGMEADILDKKFEQLEEYDKKNETPKTLGYIKSAANFVWVFTIVFIIRTAIDDTFKVAYKEIPWMFYIFAFSAIVAFVLFLVERNRNNKILNSVEYEQAINEGENFAEMSKRNLNVPHDAYEVDVLFNVYNIKKNGKVKNILKPVDFVNPSLFLYKRNNNLCFTDSYYEVSIPISNIVKIQEINKKVELDSWNKEESYLLKEFKKFKITAGQYGEIKIRKYYSIMINSEYGEFEILVPNYDIDKIYELTSISSATTV